MTARIALLLAALVPVSARGSEAADRLHQLFQEHHEWQMRESPETAMARGDYRYADRITDNSLEAVERRHVEIGRFQERLSAIDRSRLGEDDWLSYDVFGLLLRRQIEGHRFRTFLMPVGGRFGPLQTIPEMAERVRFDTESDFLSYLKRLEQVPRSVDNTIVLMRAGLTEGRTPPQVTLRSVPRLVETLLNGGLDGLAAPFKPIPATAPEANRAELRNRFESVAMPAVRDAVRRLGEFLTNEYIPRCRTTVSAAALPDGATFYAHQLQEYTTTDMTAARIHETGLAEVARIRQEMMETIRASDFVRRFPVMLELDEPRLFRAFVHYLRTDPRFYYTNEDDLLRGYRDICKRVDGLLPTLFTVLPRLPYGVRKVPDFMAPEQTTGYYYQGDIRNAQAGVFYANVHGLDQRPRYEMIPLALHEAVPGHHLQIALAQESEGLPEFRRDTYFSAFGEGWALYAEWLGVSMGLYEDPYDNFGRLLYEMWRAARLVVDTGIHAFDWSRERAVDYLLENTALSQLNVNTEVDRYIAWPGQAAAYKIGELRIRQLRKRAEEAMGVRFDVRRFHDAILGAGSLPLDLLEQRVNQWIDAARHAESAPGRIDPARG